MPVPAYIVAAQSGSIDQATNRASFFNVLEAIEGTEFEEGAEASEHGGQELTDTGLRFMVVAAWLREPDDSPDTEFEAVLWCFEPNGEPVFVSPPTPFKFAKTCHRMVLQERPLLPLPVPGLYEIRAQMRKVGDQDWIAQMSCRFHLSARTAPATPEATAETTES